VACAVPPPSPVQVCQSVTEALLRFDLPQAEQMNISEQEIRGERIVTHLKFARPADNYPVHAVCVFAANQYTTAASSAQYRYSNVPTRMAINNTQVTEADLNTAIVRAGFKLD
jgi:hypothetical protein